MMFPYSPHVIIMEFITRLASYTPVPAGGAAVANCFCMAVALIYKVILFETERNVPPSLVGNDLPSARKDLERLLRDAETLVDEDSEAYLNFVQSRREGHALQMQRHFADIIDVSLRVMEKSGAAFDWIHQLHPLVSSHLKIHLLVAGELLMGAINASVHIVKANVQSIGAEEKKQGYLSRVKELHRAYTASYSQTIDNFSAHRDAADSQTGPV